MGRAFTHVVESNGGELVSEIGPQGYRDGFVKRLLRRDGEQRWGLGLLPVPEDTTYDDMLATGQAFTEYLQAGGSADALTVEIRKPGGTQWGCAWVRYVVGRHHEPGLPLDVEIPMPSGPQSVSAAEVFDAEEAADIFDAYHQSGDIPGHYTLRPAQGYRADGTAVDVDETAG